MKRIIKVETMKKACFLLVMLAIAFTSNGQLLWKVTGNGLEKPTFVFGTMHYAPPSMIDKIAGLNQALENCDVLIVEADDSDGTLNGISAPRDSTLDKLLTPEECNVVKAALEHYFGAGGVNFDEMSQLIPAFLTVGLEFLFTQEVFPDFKMWEGGVDDELVRRAKKSGKPIDSFETTQDQYDIFEKAVSSLSLKQQALDLYSKCTDINYINKLHDEIVATCKTYQNQELGTNNTEDNPDENILINDRNRNWADQLVSKMADRSCLVAVGRGHLRGEKGLLQLLRDRGYTVESVQ